MALELQNTITKLYFYALIEIDEETGPVPLLPGYCCRRLVTGWEKSRQPFSQNSQSAIHAKDAE
jgi:hypothetical protein